MTNVRDTDRVEACVNCGEPILEDAYVCDIFTGDRFCSAACRDEYNMEEGETDFGIETPFLFP